MDAYLQADTGKQAGRAWSRLLMELSMQLTVDLINYVRGSSRIRQARCHIMGWENILVPYRAVLDLLGGLTPSGASQPPIVFIDPQKIVKNSQKYIADPPLVLPHIEYCHQEDSCRENELSPSAFVSNSRLARQISSRHQNNLNSKPYTRVEVGTQHWIPNQILKGRRGRRSCKSGHRERRPQQRSGASPSRISSSTGPSWDRTTRPSSEMSHHRNHRKRTTCHPVTWLQEHCEWKMNLKMKGKWKWMENENESKLANRMCNIIFFIASLLIWMNGRTSNWGDACFPVLGRWTPLCSVDILDDTCDQLKHRYFQILFTPNKIFNIST